MLSPAQITNLEGAIHSALACEQKTKLPASLSVAQWVLESKWGATQPGNNCFGIKAYAGCFGVQKLWTVEVVDGVRAPVIREFAMFPSLDACFEKHSALLTSGKAYASAWAHYLQTHDLETLVRQISPIYASDPRYADILLNIIAMKEVKRCLAKYRSTDLLA